MTLRDAKHNSAENKKVKGSPSGMMVKTALERQTPDGRSEIHQKEVTSKLLSTSSVP